MADLSSTLIAYFSKYIGRIASGMESCRSSVILASIKNISIKYKKTAPHQPAVLLGYSGLIQQRIE
jgi:hypothetical protein